MDAAIAEHSVVLDRRNGDRQGSGPLHRHEQEFGMEGTQVACLHLSLSRCPPKSVWSVENVYHTEEQERVRTSNA